MFLPSTLYVHYIYIYIYHCSKSKEQCIYIKCSLDFKRIFYSYDKAAISHIFLPYKVQYKNALRRVIQRLSLVHQTTDTKQLNIFMSYAYIFILTGNAVSFFLSEMTNTTFFVHGINKPIRISP